HRRGTRGSDPLRVRLLRQPPQGQQARRGLASTRHRGAAQKPPEHRLRVVAMVVPPRVLVQVALQPLRRHRVVDATDPVLHQREQPLDRLRVNVPAHVHLLREVDPPMRELRRLPKLVVPTPIIGVDDRAGQHMLPNRVASVIGRTSRDHGCMDTAATLNHAHHNSARLRRRPTVHDPLRPQLAPLRLAQLPTHERLVRLNLARQRTVVVLRHQPIADQVEHPPCGLVCHAKLTLKLLSRNPASRASHDPHRVEPQVQRRRRLMEDRPRSRIQLLRARRTSPSLRLMRHLVPLERAHLLATRTVRMLTIRRVTLTPQPIKASSIVRETTYELHHRVLRLRRLRALRVVSINGRHGLSLSHRFYSLVVKALQSNKAAARARQWHYLTSLRPDEMTFANLRKANAIVPTDPPVLTAEGALRLGAFLRPKRSPVLAIHDHLLARLERS